MKANTVLIINGPNLNLLGRRQPEIYGRQSFEDYLTTIRKQFLDIHIAYYQSNHEGELIDKLHEVGFDSMYIGVILNPGGYTHTSIAMRDAIESIDTKVVEVHISNIYEREAFRHISYITDVAAHSIVGKGLGGYSEAVEYLTQQ